MTKIDVVTEDTVRKTMLKMSPKTCDLDCMHTSFLFECTDELLSVLTNVINVSLSAGIVPKCLKQSIVKSLLEKTRSTQTYSRRSNLCQIFRLFPNC